VPEKIGEKIVYQYINMELDKEISFIEDSILKENPTADDSPSVPISRPKALDDNIQISTKDSIKIDICKLHKALNKLPPQKTFLNRSKKAELQDHLKKLMAEVAEQASGAKMIEDRNKRKIKQMVDNPEGSIECRSLYNANFILCNMLEKLSISLKDKTFNIAILEGWSSNISENKKELLIIYGEIIEKYGESVALYVDPLAKLAMVLISSATVTVANNVRSKKKATIPK